MLKKEKSQKMTHEKSFTVNIGDLLEIQRTSYYRFFFKHLEKEIEKFLNAGSFFLPSSNYLYNFDSFTELNITQESISNLYKISKTQKVVKSDSQPELHLEPFPINLERGFTYFRGNKATIVGPTVSLEKCIGTESTYNLRCFIDLEYVTRSNNYYLGLLNQVFQDFLFRYKKKMEKTKKIYNNCIFEKSRKGNFNPRRKLFRTNLRKFSKFELAYIRSQEKFYIGDIPLMTQDGTFYMNGCERVIVSQILKSPGIYFRKRYKGSKKSIYYECALISDQNSWTYLKLPSTCESIHDISFRYLVPKVGKTHKRVIFLTNLLPYLGMSWDELENSLDYPGMNVGPGHLLVPRIRIELKKRIEDYHSYISYLKAQLHKQDSDSKRKTEKKIAEAHEGIRRYNTITLARLRFIENKRIIQSVRFGVLNKENLLILNAVSKYYKRVTQQLVNHQVFSIGEIGRYRLNRKLGLNLPKNITYLTSFDLIAIINGLMGLKTGKTLTDDIDDIRNKQIRSIGELLQVQIRNSLKKYQIILKKTSLSREAWRYSYSEKSISANGYRIDEISRADSTTFFSGGSETLRSYSFPVLKSFHRLNEAFYSGTKLKIFSKSLKEFFTINPLSQYFDQTNPLAELTHKRRISVFGEEGLKRDKNISTDIRDIHPSQYAKLCPIETPEGENAGLVMTLSNFARVNPMGFIETAYYYSNQSKVYSDKFPIYLNAEQETDLKIGFLKNTLNQKRQILEEYVSAKENFFFSLTKTKDIKFFTFSPFQLISFGTSLIPFIEHDDANRALMGSNMQRQAVPLLYPQRPIVGTGVEPNVALESGLVIKNYSEGTIIFSSSTLIKVKDNNNQILSYKLKKYLRSNQQTSITQKPIYWIGEKVFSGQVIADGPSTLDGELALGRNLLIGYLPWDGYNYEDAIVLNEDLVIQNTLTSIYIDEYETELSRTLSDYVQIFQLRTFPIQLEQYFAFRKKLLTTLRLKKKTEVVLQQIGQRYFQKTSKDDLIWNLKLILMLYFQKLNGNFRLRYPLFAKKFFKKKSRNISSNLHNETINSLVEKMVLNLSTEQKLELLQLFKFLQQDISFKSCQSNFKKFVEKIKNLEVWKSYLKRKLVTLETLKKKKYSLKNRILNRNNLRETLTKIQKQGLTKLKNQVAFELRAERNVIDIPFPGQELQSEEVEFLYVNDKFTTRDFLICNEFKKNLLDENGVIKVGTYVTPGTLIVGKLQKKYKSQKLPFMNLFDEITDEEMPEVLDVSNSFYSGTEGRIIDVCVVLKNLETKEITIEEYFTLLKIYIADLRKIQVGDKLSGRHGNKGVISKVASRQDLPVLPNGKILDILVNPLGVPSRMNVGQILECLLGLAGEKLGKRFKITPFDEIYGSEASNILVNQKLKEASLKNSTPWLFDLENPGKIHLRDGRTGEFFDNPTTIGRAFILKLIHIVEEKIHARSQGPYSFETAQPLAGKARDGGQRLGEMEVWALEAHSSSYTLQELFTLKSDDLDGRFELEEYLLKGKNIPSPGPNISGTFGLLIRELNSLGLNIRFYRSNLKYSKTSSPKVFERDVLKFLEYRLKLRALKEDKVDRFYFNKNLFPNIDFSLSFSQKTQILLNFTKT